MTHLVFGVDGGRTSTKCVLATTEGRILGRGAGGPLIYLAAEGGRERMAESLREAFERTWHAADTLPQPVQAVGLGLAGVEPGTAEAHLVLDLVPQILETQRIALETDAYAALLGAHMGKPGVVAISGTGSIAMGVNAQKQRARAGGWGWLAGDEGSAFAIGRSGVRAAFNALDGVEPPTLLEEMLPHHLLVPSLYEVKRLIYAQDFGPRGFASLAPLISEAAQQGDGAALRIIREAGQALANQVSAVVRRLDFQRADVAPVGGGFEHIHGLAESFEKAVYALAIPTTVVAPRLAPVYGAVIMALEQCQVDLDKVMPVLQSQASI
ncbi:MAG: hypothetical protein M1570_10770 [Chloroflexi bacterium]|nr:hypothetical protein [Chloroflexota bacterium]